MKRKLLILMMMCLIGWLHPAMAQDVLFEDSFEGSISSEKWTLIDGDGDGNNFEIYSQQGDLGDGIVSWCYYNGSSLAPQNYIVTKDKFYITETTKLTYSIRATDGSYWHEKYSIVVSEDGNDWVELNPGNLVEQEGDYWYTNTNWSTNTVSFSDYIGKCCYIGFYHTGNGSNANGLAFDEVKIEGDASQSCGSQPLSCKVTANGSETLTAYIGDNVSLAAAAAGGTGNYTNYSWTGVTSSSETATFTPIELGSYEFTCTVTDDGGSTASGTATVNVVEKQEGGIDLAKQYRVKVNSSPNSYYYDYKGYYLKVKNHNSPDNNPNVGIVSQKEEDDGQIFTIEENGQGQYFLKTADGYYIKCATGSQWWCVYAYSSTEKTPLVFEYTNGQQEFYIKDYDKMMGNGGSDAGLTTNNYFKVENESIYCDANPGKDDGGGYVCTWVLEEYVPVDHSNDCAVEFLLYDSYGDGWQNAYLQVTYNGTTQDLGLTTGSTAEYVLWIPKDTEVSVQFVSGTYDSECYYKVKYQDFTDDIYSVEQGYVAGSGTTFTVDCSVDAFSVELTADNTAVCEGDAIQLTATASEGSGSYTYSWSEIEGLSATNVANPVFTPTTAGKYKLTCTVNDGTADVDKSIDITVYDVPEFSVSQTEIEINPGETATFEVYYSPGNTPSPDNWNFSNSEYKYKINTDIDTLVVTTNTIEQDTKIVWTLMNYDSPVVSYDPYRTQCYAETSVNINVADVFHVIVQADNTNVCDNGVVHLLAASQNAAGECTYSWSPTTGLDDPTSATPTFTPSDVTEQETITFTCAVNDGVTTVEKSIDIYVYDAPDLGLDEYMSVTMNYGDSLEISFDTKNYTVNCSVDPYVYGTRYEYPNYASGDYTVYIAHIPVTENTTFTATMTSAYADCSDVSTIDVKVVNENKESEIGTNDNGLWDRNYLPVRTESQYSISQQIYTADEIGIMETSEIKSVSFYTTVVYSGTRNIEVYLANTELGKFPTGIEARTGSASELADDFVNMTGTPIFTGEVTFVENDWTTIEFSTPFTYEAGKNLILCVNDKTGTAETHNEYGSYSTGETVRSIVMYCNVDESPYDATNISTEGSSYAPTWNLCMNNHIKLGYEAVTISELVAEINVDNTSLCDGDNSNRFEMFATRVENATYEWYVDGGLMGDTREFVYSNANPGTYTVTLKVTQNGMTSEATEVLTIVPTPNVEFDVADAFVGDAITFEVANPTEGATYSFGIYDYYDVNKAVLDNGGTWVSSEAGYFYAKVTATTAEGCEASNTVAFNVREAAKFGYDSEALCPGNEVTFNVASNYDGVYALYSWVIKDQTATPVYQVNDSEDKTMSYTFEEAGAYVVELSVNVAATWSQEAIDHPSVYTENVTINVAPVVTDITTDPAIAVVTVPVTFEAVGENIASAVWSVNGEILDGDSYTFDIAGDYTVSVTVTSEGGCTDTFEKTITVGEKLSDPKVSYQGKELNVEEGDIVDMSYRPLKAWMAPAEVTIEPDGTTPLLVNSVEIIDDEMEGEVFNFVQILNTVEDAVVNPGESLIVQLAHDEDNELWLSYLDGTSGVSSGFNTADIGIMPQLKITYSGDQEELLPLSYFVYIPTDADVVETALEPSNGVEHTAFDIAPNYQLDGADATDYDAVYKLDLTEEQNAVTVTVSGANPHVYFYNGDFNGENGPGVTNHMDYGSNTAAAGGSFVFDFEECEVYAQEGDGWKTESLDDNSECMKVNYFTDWTAMVQYSCLVSFNEMYTTENSYFITTDKYLVTANSRLSFNAWIDTYDSDGSYCEVYIGEDENSFNMVSSSLIESKSIDNIIDIDLSQYAGSEYYIKVVHNGVNSTYNSGTLYLDNITLYEPTRATREEGDLTVSKILPAAKYYVVASSSDYEFGVTITVEPLEAPEQAYDPNPHDMTDVALETEALTFTLADFSTEYQVLFGTDKDNLSTLVDWTETSETEISVEMPELERNNVYYWMVNARNAAGTTPGVLWYFATPFDAPEVSLDKTEIMVGETALLSWTELVPAVKEYEVYVDGDKLTALTDLETLQYTLSGLEYNADGYEIYIQVIFDNDYMRIRATSNTVVLYVSGYGNVYGYAYEADGTPLEGATVTFKDATFTTDAEGYYEGEALAGKYDATASKEGFRNMTQSVDVAYNGNTQVDFTLQYTFAMVKEVVATEANDYNSVNVEWNYESAEPVVFDFENELLTEGGMTSYLEIWNYNNGHGDPVLTETREQATYEIVEDADAPSGTHYIKTNIAGNDNYSACLSVEVTLSYDGVVSFYSKKSSDSYDFAHFYIDGNSQNYYAQEEWTKSEYQVPAGTHTLKWTYDKDYSGSANEDAYYIDNIYIFDNVKYNVYVKEILAATEEEQLATEVLVKEYKDETWASLAVPAEDGIYQYGVSVLYNRPATEVLNEKFDDLSNWTVIGVGGSEYFEWHCAEASAGINAYDGTSAFSDAYGSTDVYYLVSPKLNTLNKPTLEFYYTAPYYSADWSSDFSRFNVVYGATPTGPWNNLTEPNEDPVNSWTEVSVELPQLEEVYIAFVHQNVENYGLGVGLDNVRILAPAESGESKIAWSNNVARGNHFVTEGDWNVDGSWSRTHVATAEEVAVIDAAAGLAETTTVKALFVNNAVNRGSLEIAEAGILNANDAFNEDAADLVIKAGGQLVHANEGVVATFVKNIEAYADGEELNGWYTISSPLATDVNASDVTNLLSGEFDLYRYDEPTHYWENYEDANDVEPGNPDNTDWDNNSAVIEQGRGYLYANAANTELSFVGELNTAAVERTLSAQSDELTGFNLLGNPFAHDIYKGVAFAKGGELREGYYTLNYHGAWQALTDGDAIKSGAGFLVQTDTDNTSISIDKVNAATRKANGAMLAVSVANSRYEDVAYVSFKEGLGLEKIGHMNEYIPMVYVPGTFNNFAIATVEEDVTEIPVNFEAMTMGEYTIAVNAKNCEYNTMILVDKFTGKETDLRADSYTFMATTTDDPDRFLIKLSNEDSETEDSFIYINNGELVFDNLSNDAIINVFDVLGRNIATFNNCGDTTYRVSTDLFADGVYMVRLIEGNNVKVQKVVIE